MQTFLWPTFFERFVRQLRRLPTAALGWLRSASRVNTRSLHMADYSALDQSGPRRLTLVHPVIVVDQVHDRRSFDPTHASARPTGIALILLDEDIEPSDLSAAALHAAATRNAALPAAVVVHQDAGGNVDIAQARLSVTNVGAVVRTVCEESTDPHPPSMSRRSMADS